MRKVEKLLRKNKNGEGTKPQLSLRVPPLYKQALELRARELGISTAKLNVQASLKGDPELGAIMRQLEGTGGSTR